MQIRVTFRPFLVLFSHFRPEIFEKGPNSCTGIAPKPEIFELEQISRFFGKIGTFSEKVTFSGKWHFSGSRGPGSRIRGPDPGSESRRGAPHRIADGMRASKVPLFFQLLWKKSRFFCKKVPFLSISVDKPGFRKIPTFQYTIFRSKFDQISKFPEMSRMNFSERSLAWGTSSRFGPLSFPVLV